MVRQFSNEWFENQAMPLWEKYLASLEVDIYLELGVCEGRSLLWVVENLSPRLAIGVDPYVAPRRRSQAVYNKYRENARANLAGVQCAKLIEQPSEKYLRSDACHRLIPDGSVDLAYVDAGHWAWETMTDAVLVWLKVKVGGVIVFDDLNRRWLIGRPQTRVGWRGFCDAYENRWETVFHHGRQMAMRRLS